ncbi:MULTISPECIES: N-acetylmuramoyl-L-alanine amidase [Bhargavaea]|uniref:N-acetylmuramoyl-L-alanine amidase n=1 Tax=Bhargavaea changchunensis TaxID=2134037 RepID=A0ABW2NDP3_9BACL|nr:N-acetylmuramoyl-L-alanine amidase [Bhargavaea sp. CC-171006]
MKIVDIRHKTPRTNGTRLLSRIKNIARHHSATPTGSWESFWPHWRDVKKWGTGGYHEIILRDGTIQLCYDPEEITNGVGGQNSYIYHICVVGNGSFTAAQERAFEERARYWMTRFNLPVSAVKGHREFPGANTTCPGINMDTVRARLAGGNVTHATTPSTPAVKSAVKPSTPSNGSIVDYLNKQGRDSSLAARKKLAAQYDIKGYTGTASQNLQLLGRLKSGAKPVAKPAPKVPAYNGESIVDYLNMQGHDSSLSARKRLAEQYGIKNYTGTAAQNTQLLEKLQSGSAPKSKRIDTDSIVDFLKATGQSSSLSHRKKLAEKHGIKNYKGTAAQNKKLLDILNK